MRSMVEGQIPDVGHRLLTQFGFAAATCARYRGPDRNRQRGSQR